MPTVGKKKFNYSPAGRVAAQKESRRTGIPMRNSGPGYGSNAPRPMGRPMGRPMARPMGRPMRRPVENRGGARRMGTPSLGRVMTGRKRRV